MDFGLNVVAGYKSNIKFSVEANMASKAIKTAVRGKIHTDVGAIEVSDFE